jgi:curved DNA-binding protein CbpA
MNRFDCYRILGLSVGASGEEVKKAYIRLVKQWHPDINKSPEANKKMREINRAYEILTTRSPNISNIFGFDFGFNLERSFLSKSSITIDLDNPLDAEMIIRIIKTAGIKIKGYSIRSSN